MPKSRNRRQWRRSGDFGAGSSLSRPVPVCWPLPRLEGQRRMQKVIHTVQFFGMNKNGPLWLGGQIVQYVKRKSSRRSSFMQYKYQIVQNEGRFGQFSNSQCSGLILDERVYMGQFFLIPSHDCTFFDHEFIRVVISFTIKLFVCIPAHGEILAKNVL